MRLPQARQYRISSSECHSRKWSSRRSTSSFLTSDNLTEAAVISIDFARLRVCRQSATFLLGLSVKSLCLGSLATSPALLGRLVTGSGFSLSPNQQKIWEPVSASETLIPVVKTKELEKQAALERAELYYVEHPRSPSAVRRPKLSHRSGTWIALLGRSLHEGIAGFGPTVERALRAFDCEYLNSLRPPPTMDRAA